MAINCASSYRGLHEAVINHGNNKPEIITCVHEDIAVHIAQGYAKMEGKPMAMACHGVVGLQHATMAMYNAWCDRVPVLVFGGNIMEADKRMPGAEWVHSGVDIGQIVREFTKWDDQPAIADSISPSSTARAYKIATTPPMGPVFIALDAELQENPIPDPEGLRIPKFAPVVPPQGDPARHRAKRPRCWSRRRIRSSSADRVARTPAGMANLVALAEALQCGVIDNAGRMNFPSRHPLNQSFRRGLIGQADVILAIEMNDLWGTLTHFSDRIVRRSTPGYQARRQTHHARRARPLSEIQLSGFRPLAGHRSRHRRRRRSVAAGTDRGGQAPDSTTAGSRPSPRAARNSPRPIWRWSSSPRPTRPSAGIRARSPPRGCAPRSMTRSRTRTGRWSAPRSGCPGRIGCGISKSPINGTAISGGAGIGYNLPASIGAALANKKHGRFTVAFGGDGDFMFNPGALWTAAHHKIPILYIVQNNRAYHQEYMYLVAMAARHGRGVDKMDIGTTLKDPNIDYATVARGMGAHGEGPITDPKDLGPALHPRHRRGQGRRAGRGRRRHRSALRSFCNEQASRRSRGSCSWRAAFGVGGIGVMLAQDAPKGDAGKRQAHLSRRRLLHLPRPVGAGRRL